MGAGEPAGPGAEFGRVGKRRGGEESERKPERGTEARSGAPWGKGEARGEGGAGATGLKVPGPRPDAPPARRALASRPGSAAAAGVPSTRPVATPAGGGGGGPASSAEE